MCVVPGAPPRQVVVQPINSSVVSVRWQSVSPGQRNGQIRGYQVHYVRMENGEPQGLQRIRDMMLDDAQVKSRPQTETRPLQKH